jgi:cytochrome P450 family 2 subfamily U polypeptide 1
LTAYFAWSQLKRPAGIPPGPRGVPFLGYVPFIIGDQAVLYQNIAKTYGQVFSIYVFNKLAIVLNDYTNIKKALVDYADVFAGRPPILRKRPGHPDTRNLIGHEGPFWREHRRFALSTFREFGIGKSSIEPALQNEIDYFIQAITDKQGTPFNISDLLGMSVCNNICILEFGKRFEYHDEHFLQLKRAVDYSIQQSSLPSSLFGLLRSLKLIFPFLKKRDGASNSRQMILDLCKKIMVEHKNTYQPGSTRDYIDAYITEKAERERTNNHVEMFDDVALIHNLSMLFMAGTETTSTSLRWGLLYMMMHPDIQRKVQQEIDDVIGRERLPSMEDKLRMPYTEATLLEISRKGTINTPFLPHSTTEDVDFNGYQIPKDTVVFLNIWAVLFDEKLFSDPFTFRPERFINERGQFVKHEAVIPFSLGKRFCLGEPLARMELFLYFTTLLQKFNFVNPEDQVLSDEAVISSVRAPKQYTLCAIRRKD